MIDFNLRPLSWSSMSSFEYDPEQWYRKYVLNEQQSSNAGMDFGKVIGQQIADNPNFLKTVPRYDTFEKRLESTIDDVRLVGFLDSFHSKLKHFIEYKTSANTTKWTAKSAHEHGQVLFYLFLIWKNYGIPPEKIKVQLVYIPVKENNDFSMALDEKQKIQVFDVKHTTLDVLHFASRIKKTVSAMRAYCLQQSLQVDTDLLS